MESPDTDAYRASLQWRTTYPLFALCVGYIGEFEVVDDHRAGKIVVELNGRYTACHFPYLLLSSE